MIVAESIGFSATHSITEILGELPGFDVAHGSQNFETKAPVGQGAQTPADFVASMTAARDAGHRAVAVHTLLPPHLLKPACDAAGVDYWLLVRDPAAQIDSCYAWIAKSVLQGNGPHFAQVLQQTFNELVKLQVPTSLSNCLYAFAMQHVLGYNFVALGLGVTFRKMEELMADETAFRTAFDIPADLPLPHFEGERVHSASHRAREGLDALAEPDRDTIRDRFRLDIGGRAYTLADMNMLLGY